MWQRYNQCLEVGGALNQGFPFSPLMSHFRDLPDALEYKFLGCIQDHHQSQMASNGIAMAKWVNHKICPPHNSIIKSLSGPLEAFSRKTPPDY
jgi:hypothetical protein